MELSLAFLNEMKSLQEICLECPLVLVDTSAILNSYSRNGESSLQGFFPPLGRDYKNIHVELFKNFLLEGGKVLITELILDELALSSYNHKKAMKEKGSRYDPVFVQKSRDWEKRDKIRNSLSNLFSEKDCLLSLDAWELEFYGLLKERYVRFKDRFGLSESNYDILLQGFVTSSCRGPSVLVTNDSGIKKAWQGILGNVPLSEKRYSLFERMDQDTFLKVEYTGR
jgi:hypothetical protein